MIKRKSGPGSRGAKFEISKNGKVQYFHHGNAQRGSAYGLTHPAVPTIKPVIKPIVIKKAVVRPKDDDKSKSKLTRVAKPSIARKPSKAVNHHIAAGHKNLLIKRG